MAFDAHKNLAISTVTTAPSPATSGTSLGVTSGEGSRFPAAPFNATVWPAGQAPTPVNAEVVRVTVRAGDTFTIARAQEGTAARSIVAGDLIAETITAKALTDIESGANFSQLSADTADGADTKSLTVTGGGPTGGAPRGGTIVLYGNESATVPGGVNLIVGDVLGGALRFYTGPGYTLRGQVHASGAFSWGGATDTGFGTLHVGSGGHTAGEAFISLNPYGNGLLQIGVATAAAANQQVFYTPSGIAGYIQTAGTTTTYGTTSDARLKTDHGPQTDPDVLRRTVVHAFTWTADGTPGRGVFAQEAATVAPFAVSVGGDEVDASGRLTHPWGVDYSKYVPDLIVGWQGHEAALTTLKDQVSLLETHIAVLQAQVARLLARIG